MDVCASLRQPDGTTCRKLKMMAQRHRRCLLLDVLNMVSRERSFVADVLLNYFQIKTVWLECSLKKIESSKR